MRAGLAALFAGLLAATPALADEDHFVQVEHGRQLVVAGDCIACHTAANRPAFSGGRGITTPFGTINSANLTPDIETGIATWSPAEFYRALHEGKRPDGTRLYPAFPYTHYSIVTRGDTDAILAFLRTLPPSWNKVDRDTLPFPYNMRGLMAVWNGLFFSAGSFKPDPAKSAAYNRGAYLVEGLGHCGVCHTPMNVFGANKSGQAREGNRIEDWFAPNITGDTRTGVGDWSVEQVVEYLRTGRNDIAAATGPMAEVVQYSTALMTDDQLHAMAVYLKETGRPVLVRSAPLSTDLPAMRVGQAIYADTCSACHGPEGAGVPHLFPRLAGGPNIQQDDPTSLVHVVLTGAKSVVTQAAVTGPAMPSLGWRLDDDQVAAVLTFVRNSWGNAAPAVTGSDVGRVRERTATR